MWLMKMKALARLYRAPEPGEDGAGADRGDDWTPTPDEAPESPDMKAARLEKEAEDRKKDEAGAKGKEKPEDKAKGEGEDKPEDKPEGEEDKDKKKDTRIPLKRHKEMLEREREKREDLERQLKQYQGSKELADTSKEIGDLENQIAAKETEYAKALADGETEKAAKLGVEIRKLDRQISDLNAQHKIAAAEARAVETTRYQIALERVEAAYPQLNEDHDDFDKEVYDEVVDLMGAYRARGLTPTDALQKSVRMVFRGVSKTSAQEKAATVTPRVDKDEVDPEKIKAERKKGAIDKALEAVEKSPGTATSKNGLNSNEAGGVRSAKDVIKMSQDDFAKLDEKELARLRGDEIEA